MKLSNKDLLILLGIAVAVIIALTTLVYTDYTTVRKAALPETEKTSLDRFASEILKKVISKAEVPSSVSGN